MKIEISQFVGYQGKFSSTSLDETSIEQSTQINGTTKLYAKKSENWRGQMLLGDGHNMQN